MDKSKPSWTRRSRRAAGYALSGGAGFAIAQNEYAADFLDVALEILRTEGPWVLVSIAAMAFAGTMLWVLVNRTLDDKTREVERVVAEKNRLLDHLLPERTSSEDDIVLPDASEASASP